MAINGIVKLFYLCHSGKVLVVSLRGLLGSFLKTEYGKVPVASDFKGKSKQFKQNKNKKYNNQQQQHT